MPLENHQVVLCSSSSLEFQKTHPQHSKAPKMDDSKKTAYIFHGTFNICRKCPNMQGAAYEHQKCISYNLMLQKSHPANNLEMSKNPCCYNGSFQLPTSLNWFSLIPDFFFGQTSTSVSRPASFAGSCGRVTRLRFSFGLGEEVALLQGRQNVPTVGIHGKDPRKCKKPCFFQMDGRWWFFKPTIFFHGKDLKNHPIANCKKLCHQVPGENLLIRWFMCESFMWIRNVHLWKATRRSRLKTMSALKRMKNAKKTLNHRHKQYMFVKVCASISSWVCKSSVLISWNILDWATQKPDDFVANMRLGLSKWMIQYL